MVERASFQPRAGNCSGSVYMICRSSVWPRNTKKFIGRAGRCRCSLPFDSGALRLLQRIRDEAHRFANAYHQLLMKKRIGESILDDCPGVSQNRKNLLLRRFGSVNRTAQSKHGRDCGHRGNRPKVGRRRSPVLAAASLTADSQMPSIFGKMSI